MKAKDLREKTEQELAEQTHLLKKELFNLRYQAQTGRLEKPGRIRNIKRDIARISTILKERTNAKPA